MGTLKNELVWSSSREGTFRTCRRRYYYSYYGGWGGWERGADARTRELYALKQLSSRPLWAGRIVHDEISSLLRRLRDGGPEPDHEQVEEQTVQKMRGQFRISRDTDRDIWRSDPKRTFRLMEHEYRMDLGRERWVETREKVVRCLRNFFRSKAYAALRERPAADWLHVEDPADGPDRLRIWEMDVWALPDCVYRDGGGAVHVIDWKTGKKEGANWDQLALYAMYAQERWGVPAASVRAREVNLFLDTDTEHHLEEGLLDRLRERIRSSLEEMRACLVDGDAERNEPLEEEAFPLVEDTWPCRWCAFQGICPAVAG